MKPNSVTTNGFGDKVRGAIATYQYCKKNKINFKIDMHEDVASYYLKNNVLPPEEQNKIKNKELQVIDYEKSLNNDLKVDDDNIYMFTNNEPTIPLSKDDKAFAKYLLEPNDTFNAEVVTALNKLKPNFGIKHVRFNDDSFFKDLDNDTSTQVFKTFFKLLKNSYKETDVLMTNSENFKKYAKKQLNISTIYCNEKNDTCNIKHTGLNNDYNSSKFSFIEFYIISHAKYIDTYTVYNWPSNFVVWSSYIFDIPLTNTFVDENGVVKK
jgi:hypothetical protein